MKTVPTLIIIASLAAAVCARAAEQGSETPAKPASLSASEVEDLGPAKTTAAPMQTKAAPEEATAPKEDSASGGLLLNFRGAPLNLVLDYLSDAAGFIINKETEVSGTVDVWSKRPVSKDEAVELLNSVLRKNGYAVIQNGRILTIVSLENAKTADTDVGVSDNADDIEKSDEVVTRIIPVRHANATQLMNNLQVLLPTTATLSVNESANSLIMVATKTEIKRMLKIVNALDSSIASVASIKVFTLNYADAKQLATVIQQLFAPDSSAQGANARARMFAMFRGGGRFGGPGGGGAPSGGGEGGNAAGSRVVAAADDYSNSLIVSAAPDLMATISDMVQQIDQPISDVTEVRVFHLVNADPVELADQLSQLFPDDSRSTANNNGQNRRFRFFGGPFGRSQGGNQATTDRSKKKDKVVAVADARTSSLIVTAAADMMPQIAEMIAQLDASKAKKEMISSYDLRYADPQDVLQVLQDLFNKNNTMRVNSNTRGSMLGQNNPLSQRATSQQYNSSRTSTGFGSQSRSGGTGF